MKRLARSGEAAWRQGGLALQGPWPEGPWWLLGLAACAAPLVVRCQGGNWHTATLAALVCLATPGGAIEAMAGLARAALPAAPPER